MMRRFVSVLVALALVVVSLVATVQHQTVVVVTCTPACREIEYGSFWWYIECWPLPESCSAGPGGGGGSSGAGSAALTRGGL